MKSFLSFVKENFTVLAIAFLILFLWFQGCFTRMPGFPEQPTIIIQQDTSWKALIGKTNATTTLVQTIPYPVEKIEKQYLPDTNYQALKKQFEQLRDLYLSRNIYKDSLKIDTIGTLYLTDTTHKNTLSRGSYSYNLRYPTITKIITIKDPPRTQLYYGGELSSPLGQTLGIQQAQVGILLKNKKDNILKLSSGYNFQTNSPHISLGYYKKFSFK
jgi:hypothetical protein